MTTQDKSRTDDIMANITHHVIDAIANGTAPWQMPWQSRGDGTMPKNLATGERYRGLNSLFLSIIGAAYGSHYWVGYSQAAAKGGHVKKGEKATAILAPVTKCIEQTDGTKSYRVIGFRSVSVFNFAQCDGLTLPESAPAAPRAIDCDALDSFARDTGADIQWSPEHHACYIPSLDVIRMPLKEQFTSAAGYYGTLLHELTHWTGHKSRLDRLNAVNRSGYAFEELIAELGAYYASELVGCPNAPENHVSYVASWLKALNDDTQYVWRAASAAERAAQYLIARVESRAVAA